MQGSNSRSLTIFRLLLSALVAVVIFLLLINPEYNVLLNSENKKLRQVVKESTFDNPQPDWKYNYWSDISASDSYPIVHLRSGYKVIKEKGEDLLVGWKYELVNSSSTDRTVTVYYKITDSDGFYVGTGNSSKTVPKKSYEVIKGTLFVEKDDIDRIKGSSWSISLKTVLTTKNKSKGNRFDLAGEVLKDNGPWWLKRFVQYRFDDKKSFEREKLSRSKWYRIAKVLDISYDEELTELRTKLSLVDLDLPPWAQVRTKSEYRDLSKEEREKIKIWLALQGVFGGYDAKKGRGIQWKTVYSDFED